MKKINSVDIIVILANDEPRYLPGLDSMALIGRRIDRGQAEDVTVSLFWITMNVSN